jgi:hypothetical protein
MKNRVRLGVGLVAIIGSAAAAVLAQPAMVVKSITCSCYVPFCNGTILVPYTCYTTDGSEPSCGVCPDFSPCVYSWTPQCGNCNGDN